MSKKRIKTKNGMKPVFSFCLEDHDGDENWFRTGFVQPEFEKGDEIEFDFEVGDYGSEVVMDSISIVNEGDSDSEDDEEDEEEEERPARKAKPAAKANKRGQRQSGSEKQGSGAGKEGYWDRKEARDLETDLKISYAAARNAAIDLVPKMVELQLLTIPKTKKVAAFEAYVDQYTDKFFAAVCDVECLKAILKDAAKAAPVAENEGDDEDEERKARKAKVCGRT
jgi:hypothetical protein